MTRTQHARTLFDGIADAYGGPAELFSFGQYGRWRRAAVEMLALEPGALVLDVATGTGLVGRDVIRRWKARVIGLDQSEGMLRRARLRGFPIVGASAEALPFADNTFDALTFTYLLRYVDDPRETIAELVRALRPGAAMASVEFGRPGGVVTKPLWELYAKDVFRLSTRPISKGWREVGEFLGPSIERFNDRFPPDLLASMWRDAGMTDVGVRTMSLGGGVVMWGRKR